MHYDRHMNRPPEEASNILLQVTSGCSHNKCSYCNSFPENSFCVSPLEHVEEDLIEVSKARPEANRVWLLNGDAFVLSYVKLVTIAELIHKYLNNITSIGMYSTISNIKNKTVEELTHLNSLGVNGLYIGVETGDEEALKIANTGYVRDDIPAQLKKLEAAGITYQIMLMAGLGGSGSAERVGKNTAEILSSLHPKQIFLGSVFLLPGTDLHEAEKNGGFVPPSEKEYLCEHYAFAKYYCGNSKLLLMPVPNPQQMFTIKNNTQRKDYLKYLEDLLSGYTDETEKEFSETRAYVGAQFF